MAHSTSQLPVLLLLIFSTLNLSAFAQCTVPDSFSDNKNGTLTDKRTGLIWKICPETTSWDASTGSCQEAGRGEEHMVARRMNYAEALETAAKSRFLGHADWRLPSLTEMKAIVGTDCGSNSNESPAVSARIAKNLHRDLKKYEYGFYWTSTMDPKNPSSRVMGVGFSHGQSFDLPVEDTFLPITRLVRSAKVAANSTPDVAEVKKAIRRGTIEIGDTVAYDRKDFKWVGVVVSQSDTEYQIKLIEINTGAYFGPS